MRRFFILCLFCSSVSASAAPLDRQEQRSSQADKVLKHLGQYFTGSMKRAELQEDLSENLQVNIAVPAGIWISKEGNLSLFQVEPDDSAKSTNTAKVTSLKLLKKQFSGDVIRTKFKIIEVIENKDQPLTFETRQLVALFLKDEHGHREINTEWLAQWIIDGDTVQLKSLSGSLTGNARLDTPELMYHDLTGSLLRMNRAEAQRIQEGTNYWLPRLERVMQPEFFALSGLSVADVNGDHLEDVYLCQLGGMPNMLFIQQADGTFVNRASEAGLDFYDNTTSALFVDFDNDGDQDLAMATASGLVIMENDSSGQFKLKKLYKDVMYSYSLCAADYDQDGLVDIYACRYYGNKKVKDGQHSVQGNLPVPYPVYDARNGGRNTLLRNRGDLSFDDVTQSVGLNEENNRFSYAAFWEDLDNDGDQDIYVANDFGGNNYYRNHGGKFTDVTRQAGLYFPDLSMGACAGDFDGNGWMDIHVSNMFSSAGSRVTRQLAFKEGSGNEVKEKFQKLAKGNSLLFNSTDGKFIDASDRAGITVGRWSWASLALDLNNDGWDDLLVANGFLTGKKADDL